MNANLQAVFLGVISNVLTAFLISPFSKDSKKPPSLKKIIRDAIEEVSDAVEWSGKPQVEEVCLFLTSPEVESVVRQIYSTALSESREANIDLIRDEFLQLFSATFELRDNATAKSANKLFDTLLECSENALKAAIENGILSAHEGMSTARHRRLLDELSTIQKNLNFLTAKRGLNIQEVLEFEKKYRAQIAERHGRITPPNFDSARKLPIDDIYVAPSFSDFCLPGRNNSPKGQPHSASFLEFLSQIYRIVLLGNPGGGKSTLTNKICYDLAAKYEERPFAGRQLTPIPVILRDYGADKKAHNYSILQFIEATANSSYQVQAPAGAFDYLLLNGRVVVIFDGLDELLETNYRQKIAADVESFCNLYPAVPILVTSREVGYEQAPLSDERFETYRLAPFNEEQVKEYVGKWFEADADLTDNQKKQQAQAFLNESRIVPDLRSNPLMLALMCNIYRGENYIPQNRPDLYEKCAVMLFERWDKQRGIIVPLPFEAHIRPAMMYLAHWIYTNAPLQSGVSEQKLIDKITEYLLERRFDDRDEAEMAARDFIEFCKGRAWVFTDTGAGLYQFTHRTFLEYFTAFHIVRKHSTPELLKDVLIKRIGKSEWDIVSQVAVQLQNKYSEGAGDKFLSSLIVEAKKLSVNSVDSWGLISFSVRCLQFLVPSPAVRREIASTCFERFIEWGHFKLSGGNVNHPNLPSHRFGPAIDTLGELLYAANENRATIAKALRGLFADKIKSHNVDDASLAFEFTIALPVGINVAGYERQRHSEQMEFWNTFVEELRSEYKDEIIKHSRSNLGVCNFAYLDGFVDADDIVEWHGVSGLFLQHWYTVLPFRISIVSHMVESNIYQPLISDLDVDEFEDQNRRRLEQFTKVGSILSATVPPWCEGKKSQLPTIYPYLLNERVNRKNVEINYGADAEFCMIALLATCFESTATSKQTLNAELLKALNTTELPLVAAFRKTLIARFRPGDALPHDEIDSSRLTDHQKAIMLKWALREINFVNRLPTPRTKKNVSSKKRAVRAEH